MSNSSSRNKRRGLCEDCSAVVIPYLNKDVETRGILLCYKCEAKRLVETLPSHNGQGVSEGTLSKRFTQILIDHGYKEPMPISALSTAVEEAVTKAFRDGQLDCKKAGDPRNHDHFEEAVRDEKEAMRMEVVAIVQSTIINSEGYNKDWVRNTIVDSINAYCPPKHPPLTDSVKGGNEQ